MSQARPEKKQDASPASPAAIELPPLSFPKDITGSLEFTMEEIKGIIAAAINKDPLISKVGQALALYPEHLPHVGPKIKAAAGDGKEEEKNAEASVIAEKLAWLFNRLPKGGQLKETDRQYIFSIVNELIKRATATLVERFKKLTQDRSSDLAREVSVVLSSLQRDEAGKELAHKLIKQRIGSGDNLASAFIALADIFFTARAIGACDRQAVVNIEENLFAAVKDEAKSSQGDKKSETKETPMSYAYQSFLKEINLLGSKEITDSKISNDLLTIKLLLQGIKDLVFSKQCNQSEFEKIANIYRKIREMIKLINAEVAVKGTDKVLIQQLISILQIANILQNRLHGLKAYDFSFPEKDHLSEEELVQLELLHDVYRTQNVRQNTRPAGGSIITTRRNLLHNQYTEIKLQFDAQKEKEIRAGVKDMMRTASYVPGQNISLESFFYLFQAMNLEIAVGTINTGCLSSTSSFASLNNLLQLIMDGSPAVLDEYLQSGSALLMLYDSNLALLLTTYLNYTMEYASFGLDRDYLRSKAALDGAMQCMSYFARGLACIPRSFDEIIKDSALGLLVAQIFPGFVENEGARSSCQNLDIFASEAPILKEYVLNEKPRDLYEYVCAEYRELEEAMAGLDQAAQVDHQAITWPELEEAKAKQDALEMQQQVYLKELEAKAAARKQELEAKQKAEANFRGLVKQADQKDASVKRKAEQKSAKEKQLQEQKDEAARTKSEQQAERKKQQELKSGDGKLIQQEAKAKAIYDPDSVQGELYDKAGQLLRRNEYMQAKSLYDQAIKAANEASQKDHVIIVCSYVELAECKLREADNYLRTIKGMVLTSSEDAAPTIKRISDAYLAASLLVQRAINHCADHLATDSNVSPEQLQQIEASTRFIQAKLESSAAVNYEPVLMPELSEEDLPLEQHQFCLSLEKSEESKDSPALFYRVMSPQGEIVNGVIDNAELKQSLGDKCQDFLNAVASQNQSELRSFLNRDLLKITAKRGQTFKGFLSNNIEWLDKLIKEDEADEQKLEQSRVEARKRLGVHAWKHKYKKVVLVAEESKEQPSDIALGVIVLRKSGTQITAYFKKYQTVFSETLDVRDTRPDLLGCFSKHASQERSDDKFVLDVAALFYCLSREYYLKKELKKRKTLAKQILSSLEKSRRALTIPLDDLRLLHSYAEPKLITAPDPKEDSEQKAVIIYSPGQVPAVVSASYADGLQILCEKRRKKAISAAPAPQLAAPQAVSGAEIKVEKVPAATLVVSAATSAESVAEGRVTKKGKVLPVVKELSFVSGDVIDRGQYEIEEFDETFYTPTPVPASKAKAAFFSAAVSASPASVPQASASRPAPKAESKRGKLLLSPGVAPVAPTASARPGSPKH